MSYAVTEVLKLEVLSYLGYTDDCGESIKRDVNSFINKAVYRLNEIAGAEIDYDKDLFARELLNDYCRYLKAGASAMFEDDYQSKLNSLYLKYRVEEFQNNAEN